jgi:hypothetical protein
MSSYFVSAVFGSLLSEDEQTALAEAADEGPRDVIRVANLHADPTTGVPVSPPYGFLTLTAQCFTSSEAIELVMDAVRAARRVTGTTLDVQGVTATRMS